MLTEVGGKLSKTDPGLKPPYRDTGFHGLKAVASTAASLRDA